MTFKHRNHSWSLVVTRGHSWSLVVTRGHSWSLVVTRGHSWSLVVTRGHSWSFVVNRGHSWSLVCTFRQDRGGGVLLAVKAESFQTVREFPVPADMDRLQLEIVAAELTTESNHKIIFCSCYKPPDVNISWSDEFNDFLNNICDQYENLLIVGDFNLSNISWDSNNNAFGANEMSFVDALHDHYLSQIINIPTRGSNILDLVMHLSMLTPRGGGSGKGWGFDQSGGPMGRDLD